MSASDQNYTPDDRERVEAMAAIWCDVMSPGDKSTAFVAAHPEKHGKDPDDTMVLMTSQGSPNDRFWSQMVALGWAEPRPDSLDELPTPEQFAAFALTSPGRTMLPQFLEAVER